MITFLLTCIAIELTPGPNMTFLALLSALKGRAPGLLMVTGIASGLFVVGLAAAAGAQSLLNTYPQAYGFLRWSGVVYMMWLAYDAWKGSAAGDEGKHHSNYFLQGFITNLLNPKAFIFYLAILPSFATKTLSSLILTLISVSIATTIHLAIVLAADKLRPLLTTQSKQRLMGRVFSILLLLIALWIATKK